MNDYIGLYDYKKILKIDNSNNYNMFIYIVFIIIVLLYLLIFIKIDNYYVNECLVKEDLLICTVKYDELKYIVNNNELYINDEIYKYKVYSIEEELSKMNNSYYKNINLSINLKNSNMDNNILKIRIKIYHNNFFDYMINVMMGGKNETSK